MLRCRSLPYLQPWRCSTASGSGPAAGSACSCWTFACYKPPDDLKVSYEGFITGLANAKVSAQLLPSRVSP